MMKKWLNIALAVLAIASVLVLPPLLCPVPASVAILGSSSNPVCDSIAGSLIFSSHFENVNVGLGFPCGGSTNATKTWTYNGTCALSADAYVGWPSDGGYAIKRSAATSYGSIPLVITPATGTATFDVLFHTVPTAGGNFSLIQFFSTTANYCRVYYNAAGGFVGQYKGNNVSQVTTTLSLTPTADVVYHFTFKWQTAASPYIFLDIDGTNVSDTSATTAMTTGTVSVYVLSDSAQTETAYMDKLKVYNAYL